MAKISTSDFQKGIFINFRGEVHQIVEFQHVNPGKGSAFVRTKLKNLKTANTIEFTYKSGEQVEKIPINTREMQFLYKDDLQCYFMDQKTFEQFELGLKDVGNFSKFLRPEEIYQILIRDEKAIGMRYPKKVKLTVTEAEEAVKGNTATGAKKTVVLETGVKANVPLFIKKGDIISIDPDTGDYLERV